VIPVLEAVYPQGRPDFDEKRWLTTCRVALCLLEERGELRFEEEHAELTLVLVDDAEIARIHGEFLEDPTPTDVITFHHGEIVVSHETAAREAAVRQIPLEEELLRYTVHGVLHLIGYDDLDPADHKEMHAVQEGLIREVMVQPG